MGVGEVRRIRQGIGSFAFRYAIGFQGFTPEKPMDTVAFLEEAHRLGFQGVQLCENLKYASLDRDQLRRVKEKAGELGLFLEIGMNFLSKESLHRHLDIADQLESDFLRVVLGSGSPLPEKNAGELRKKAIDVLRAALPRCREQGVTIGIENHFDLPSRQLREIVDALGDKCIGLILDTTNGLGFAERPEETLDIFKGHIVSIHLKDYEIRKIEAGYMMTGAVLGEGSLKAEHILGEAVRSNPALISLIMEMTVRRQEKQALDEIISWEQDAVYRSAAKLFKLVEKCRQ